MNLLMRRKGLYGLALLAVLLVVLFASSASSQSVGAQTSILPIPSGLTASASGTTVTLDWDDTDTATAYDYQYKLSSDEDYGNETEVSNSNATVINLVAGQTYDFQVRAKSDAGNSDWSPAVSQTLVPSVPSGLTAVAGTTVVELDWDSETGATSYDYQYKLSLDEDYGNETEVNASEATVINLEASTEYDFRVRSTNAEGDSEWSTPVSATTGALLQLMDFDESGKHVLVKMLIEAADTRVGSRNILYQDSSDDYGTLLGGDDVFAESDGGTESKVWRIFTTNDDEYFVMNVNNDSVAPLNSYFTSSPGNAATWWIQTLDDTIELEVTGGTADFVSNGTNWARMELNSSDTQTVEDIANGDRFTFAITLPLPSDPTGLSSTAQTEDSLTFDWDDVTGTTGTVSYVYQYKESTANSWNAEVDIIASTVTLSSLTSGTTYNFRVKSKDDVGPSGWATANGATTDPTTPPVPENISVTISGTTATLDWDDSEGAVTYDYQHKLSTASYPLDGTEVSVSSATIMGLTAGRTYNFRVRATNAEGDSDWTSDVSGTVAPAVPTGVTNTAQTATSLTFDWDDVSGATSYKYQYKKSTDTNWSADVSVAASTATVLSLESGVTYDFKVKASNAGGDSAFTTAVQGTTLPATPTGLSNTAQADDSLTFDWDDMTGATAYVYQYKKSTVAVWNAEVEIVASTVTLSSLTGSTTYNFRVKSKSAAGESGFATANGTTATTPTFTVVFADASLDSGTAGAITFTATGYGSYGALWANGNVQNSATNADVNACEGTNLGSSYEALRNSQGSNAGSPRTLTASTTTTCPDGSYNLIVNLWSSDDSAVIETVTVGFTVGTTTAPPTPSNLVVTDTQSTSVTLDWDDSEGADTYDYAHKLTSEDSWPTETEVAVSTVTISSLTANTEYDYRVRATNAIGDSGWRTITQQLTAPAAPTGVTNTAQTDNSLTFDWDDVSGATSYKYQYKKSTDTNWSADVSVTPSTVTVLSLESGVTYDFKVKASNAGGDSAFTTPVQGTTLPATPTGVTNTAQTDNSLTFDWDDVSGATGYKYQYRESGNANWNAEVTIAASQVVLSSLSQGTTHEFQVRAYNSAGNGAYATAVQGTTLPAAPTGVTNTAQTDNSLTFDWDDVSGATSYKYQYKKSTDTNWSADVSVTPSTVTVLSLESGVTYDFKVKASNAGGDSAFTTPVQGTTLPATPTGVTNTAQTDNSLTFDWDDVSGATGYKYQYRESGNANWNAEVTIAASQVVLSSLSQGTTHEFQVRAYNSAGNGAYATAVQGTTTLPAPTGLTTTAQTTSSLTFDWGDVTNADGYEYQHRLASSDTWGATQAVAASTVTISSLEGNTEYEIQVRAENSVATSAWTSAVRGMTSLSAPPTPANLSVTSTTASSAVFDWDDVATATGYKYQYRVSGGLWSTAVSVVQSTVTLSSLVSGTTYNFQVLATNSAGDSSYTSAVDAVTNPSPPTGLSSTSDSDTQLTFTWSAVTGATTYAYQHKVSTSNAWSSEATTSNLTVTLSSLTAATTYDFRVLARNTGGDSTYATDTETTQIPAPAAPTSLTASGKTSSSITYDWADVTHAASYDYQYRADGTSWPGSSNVSASTVTISGLNPNSVYDFRVQSQNTSGTSGWTTLSDQRTLLPTPEGLSVTSKTSTSVTLDWDDVTGASNYGYQYREGSTGSWGTEETVNVSEVTISSLTAGVDYTMRFRAKNSNVNSEWTEPFLTSADLVTPTGLTVDSRTTFSVTFDWNDVAKATGYEYQYREKTIDSAWSESVSVSISEATVTGLSGEVVYEMQVRARAGTKTSSWTSALDFAAKPVAVEGIRLSEKHLDSLIWAWKVRPGADRYYWQHRAEGTSDWGSTSAYVTENQIEVESLSVSTTYEFRVRTYTTNGGFSDYSNTFTATTSPPEPFTRKASSDFTINDLFTATHVPDGTSSPDDYKDVEVWGGYRTDTHLWVGYSYKTRSGGSDVNHYEVAPISLENFAFGNSVVTLDESNTDPGGFVIDGQDLLVCDHTDRKVYGYDHATGGYLSPEDFSISSGCLDMAMDDDNYYILHRDNTSYAGYLEPYRKSSKTRVINEILTRANFSSYAAEAVVWSGTDGLFIGSFCRSSGCTLNYYGAGTLSHNFHGESYTGSSNTRRVVHLDFDPADPSDMVGTSSTNYNNVNTITGEIYLHLDRNINDFYVNPRNMYPEGIYADDETIWIADSKAYRVFAYDLDTKAYIPSKSITFYRSDMVFSRGVGGVARDDNYTYVAGWDAGNWGRVILFNSETSARIDMDSNGLFNSTDSLAIQAGVKPKDIWTDGVTLWAVRSTDVGAWTIDTRAFDSDEDWTNAELRNLGITKPTGLWSDEVHWWISDETFDKILAFTYDEDRDRVPAHDFDALRVAGNTDHTYIAASRQVMYATDDNTNEKYLFSYNMDFQDAPAFFTADVPVLKFEIDETNLQINVQWESIEYATSYDVLVDNSLPLTVLDAEFGSVQSYAIDYEADTELATVAVRARACADDDEALEIELDDNSDVEVPAGQCSYSPYSETLVVRLAAVADVENPIPEGITAAVDANDRVALAVGEILELAGAIDDAKAYNTRNWLPPLWFLVSLAAAGGLIAMTSKGGISPGGVFVGCLAFTILFGIIGPLSFDVPIQMAVATILFPIMSGVLVIKTRV